MNNSPNLKRKGIRFYYTQILFLQIKVKELLRRVVAPHVVRINLVEERTLMEVGTLTGNRFPHWPKQIVVIPQSLPILRLLLVYVIRMNWPPFPPLPLLYHPHPFQRPPSLRYYPMILL